MRIVSWNVNRQEAAWHTLLDSGDCDVALLQEAQPPPTTLTDKIEVDLPPPWHTGGAGQTRPWRAAVARISDRVQMRPLITHQVDSADSTTFATSRAGTIAAAEVVDSNADEHITVVSMYGAWERPIDTTGSGWIYADASVHRLISDLSILIGQQRGHRIIAAGDLNILRGYGENGSDYWRARYSTVFDRMEAIGLTCVGPCLPDGGLPPSISVTERPHDSTTVPTFRTQRTKPETATRQLDFVFASHDLAPRVRTRALNRPDEWGPSDHCRLEIELVQ